jgi:hypothetical protein
MSEIKTYVYLNKNEGNKFVEVIATEDYISSLANFESDPAKMTVLIQDFVKTTYEAMILLNIPLKQVDKITVSTEIQDESKIVLNLGALDSTFTALCGIAFWRCDPVCHITAVVPSSKCDSTA